MFWTSSHGSKGELIANFVSVINFPNGRGKYDPYTYYTYLRILHKHNHSLRGLTKIRFKETDFPRRRRVELFSRPEMAELRKRSIFYRCGAMTIVFDR
jgi:hypothetical protein